MKIRRSIPVLFWLLFSVLISSGQNAIIFNKKNSSKDFSRFLFDQGMIKMKDGKRYVGILPENNDSHDLF